MLVIQDFSGVMAHPMALPDYIPEEFVPINKTHGRGLGEIRKIRPHDGQRSTKLSRNPAA